MSAPVNTPFTVTIQTSVLVTKVKIVGESGSSIGTLTRSKVDKDGVPTWTISIKVGSKGNRTLTAQDPADTEPKANPLRLLSHNNTKRH